VLVSGSRSQMIAQAETSEAARGELGRTRESEPLVAEPGLRETVLLAAAASLVFVAVVLSFSDFGNTVDNFGDSSAYISIASAIRRWDFQNVVVKQFWGLPYAVAAVSWLTELSDRTALLVVSFASSIVTIVLAWHLWGGWVAGFFVALNFDWLQRSVLGGSEPLFMALLLGSFLAIRRQRWVSAALLAASATIVRPLGIFALAGIGIVLLWKRDYWRLAGSIAVALAIALLYMLPMARLFRDPLATVHSYQAPGQSGPALFGVPFYAIIKGTLLYPSAWTNLVLTFGWIAFVLIGAIAMTRTAIFREYSETNPVEVAFAVPYLVLIYCYNYPYWARGNFPRFAIPILPFVLLALYHWIPKDRAILWTITLASAALSAVSALGLRNVLGMLQKG
jgi:hypothetical protein